VGESTQSGVTKTRACIARFTHSASEDMRELGWLIDPQRQLVLRRFRHFARFVNEALVRVANHNRASGEAFNPRQLACSPTVWASRRAVALW
jgi:hypothetical protein